MSNSTPPADDSAIMVEFLLAQARLLGASASDEAIRRFWFEMHEAMHALEAIGPIDGPLDIAFDPQWPGDSRE